MNGLLIFNNNGIAICDRVAWLILGVLLCMLVQTIRKPSRDMAGGTLLIAAVDSMVWWYLVCVCWDADGHLTKKFGETFTSLAKGFPWTVPPLLLVAAIVVSKMKPRTATVVHEPDPPGPS